jgi:hypothetical protein
VANAHERLRLVRSTIRTSADGHEQLRALPICYRVLATACLDAIRLWARLPLTKTPL